MKKSIVHFFAQVWRADDQDFQNLQPDIIVALSYAVKKYALTNGTRETLKTAIEYWKKFSPASLVFASTSHSFPSSEKAEEEFKFEIIDRAGVPRTSVLSCGPIVNTVTEAEAICRTLQKAGKRPKNILLITGTMHSRGAKYIWEKTLKKYFPSVNLSITTIPFDFEYQKDHPLFFQRGPLQWIMGNVARQLALRLLGLKLTGKLREPSNLD